MEVIEDHPTWKHDKEVRTVVDEMCDVVLVTNSHDTELLDHWLNGDERESAWLTYGPRDDDPAPM